MNTSTFGGPWTQEKLGILGRYLDAYTTALSRQRFRLIYFDAFAGEGSYQPAADHMPDDYQDFHKFREFSPRIALEVNDKPFDRLVFVEKSVARCESLESLKGEFANRDIHVLNDDANNALPSFCDTLGPMDRAVVFLDPFAAQVSWNTVEKIAQTKKIDC